MLKALSPYYRVERHQRPAAHFPRALRRNCRRSSGGKVVHRRTLGRRLGRDLEEAQAPPLDERQIPIDSVAAEAVDAQGILPAQHLPGADGFQDAQLVRREALRVDDGLLLDLRFGLGRGERGGGFGVVGEHGGLHLLEDRFVFVRGVVFERVEAEVDGVVDLFLAELAADIGCALDDWERV